MIAKRSSRKAGFWILVTSLSLGVPAEFSPAQNPPLSGLVNGPELLNRFCYDCHADGSHKGDVALDELLKSGKSVEHLNDWKRTWKIVRHEFMPPTGKPSPTPAERKALTDWMAAEMLGVELTRPDPGRVTIRRLNRMEYENSVQDLFATELSSDQDYSSDVAGPGSLQLKLRDRLPPDETAFGFDNIGDFLTLPPALLERYFEIADFIAHRVVSIDGPRPPEQRLGAADFKSFEDPASKRTSQTTLLTIPRDGKYQIDFQFTLGGWQEFGGEYSFSANIGTTTLAREQLVVGGYKTHKHTALTDLKAGSVELSFTTTPTKPDAKGVLNPLDLRPVARITGPLDPAFAVYPESHRRIFFNGTAPAETSQRHAYAREILERIASRAFRRPVEVETLDGLVAIADRNSSFERGIAHAITAILTSPKFLFRSETQPLPNDPASIHQLDEYALASRLSHLIWLSLPDEELTQLAAKGQLRSNLHGQVQRMMADRKSARFFEDFPGQWLRTRNILMTPISGKGSGALDPVRSSMKRETEMLFEDIARNDRDLIELITADYTFLDKRLADYYGIKGVSDAGFQKVSLPADSRRGGLLTHGSFLVSTSNPNRTSPVKRGLFVLENLLGIEPPPPPPNVPALDDVNIGEAGKKTGRELLALHRADKSCAGCHAHFDPIGIALENFDLTGRWRNDEDGLKIDAAETSASGERISGLEDVRRLLTQRKELLYRGITEKLMTYALGRGLDPADAITVDRIVTDLSASGGKFSTLLFGIIDSRSFQMRRGDAGGTKTALRDSIPRTPPPEKRRPPRKSPAFTKPAAKPDAPRTPGTTPPAVPSP